MSEAAAPVAPSSDMSRGAADHAALLRARLVQNAETTPGSMIANAANFCCTVGALFAYDLAKLPALLAAALILTGALAWRWWAVRNLPDEQEADIRRLDALSWHVTWSAALLGGFWGAAALYTLSLGDPQIAMFAGVLGAGMMSAGAITYRSMPQAALAWICAAGLLSAVGLAQLGTLAGWISLGLLLCFLMVLRDTISTNGQRFASAFLQQRELQRSSETIQLLLNDFTEQGSDWLIEVDRKGRIVDPCQRLAEATSRPVETLAGLPFGQLFEEGEARTDLRAHFMEGRVIRRHILSLSVAGDTRWWAISARPVADPRIAYRGVVTDITAQRQAEERVSYLAHFDGLTDLPNRFLFNEKLYRMLNRGSRSAGVMYIDLDHFKTVNDTLGHPVGDRLLQAVARRLEAIVGPGAMVARFGGDEFAVLVPPRRIGTMDRLAARIIDDLSSPLSLGDHDVLVGASIGMAVAPQDADTRESLMRMADLALYAAKGTGRGTARRFVPEMDSAAQARRQIEMDLRVALAQGQLHLHYQPMVDGASGRLIGCEALIRWVHPDRGVVMPDAFIGVAEDTGLIIPIGEWAIRQALADAGHWPEDVEIAINLSPLQMRGTTLISTIVGALAANGVAPSRLCLEITESVLMQDSAVNVETLHKLRSLGIRIALDDFGTGYSSLNYLRSFPFDKIKIDRCFVSEVDSRDDCRAIVCSVVDLAASLGMQTVAEGVERESQAVALRTSGCEHLQGFLYSRAVPAAELTDLRPMAQPVGDSRRRA